jgi:NADH dehydrogenase
LAKNLAEATGAELDRAGRISVGSDLSLPGHPEIFVLGDMANYTHQGGKPLPGVAPVAIQEGRFVAKLIRARLESRTLPKFRYRELNLATIIEAQHGRLRPRAVQRFRGLVWLFIHLSEIIATTNQILVFMQWA